MPSLETGGFLDNTPMPPTSENIIFKTDFNSLFVTICKKATFDAPTLLLYLLLHRNSTFKAYLLGRLDLQELVSQAEIFT